MGGTLRQRRAVPILDSYIALLEAVDTLFHMPMVDDPTELIALIAAMKMRARISPYSTAVAALVDRSSLAILVIVLPLPIARISPPKLRGRLVPGRFAVRTMALVRACFAP